MTPAERLAAVRARVAAACAACGRDPASVGLIAVGKTFPAEAVAAVHGAGQVDFGENYAQELRDKAAALAGSTPPIRWHFIGRIQTNKAKMIAPVAYRVHAVEEVRQAEALAARAPGPLDVLVAVNQGGEDTKGGVRPSEALERCAAVDAVPGVRVVGLMTLPPPTEDPEDSAPYFEELAALAAAGRARGLALNELSMGMSHDFEVAIRHGATWVRVGTAIFGARG
jgi:pyridoxal phosphate enzyme (YggS family)